MSGLSGALSFWALATKSFGSSGGGALVGSNDGTVPVALGRSETPGSWDSVPGRPGRAARRHDGDRHRGAYRHGGECAAAYEQQPAPLGARLGRVGERRPVG